MDKWQQFLKEVRTPSRGSPAGIRHSLGAFLTTGPHTGGSPYEDEDEFLKGKKNRNQVSAPPGAPGGLEEEADLEEERSNSYRNRIRSYTKDRDEMLNVGGQKNTPPFTQKMGSHVTFDKQINNIDEEVEPESFEKNPEMESRFWRDGQLHPKVAHRLTKIANDFLERLDVPAEMVDLRFTGSLANFNWSKYSDIDLHLVVDFAEIDGDAELVKAFFDAARMRWNGLHDITVYGYEVELYVENVGDAHRSSGVYSITNKEWIKAPDPDDVHIDFATARAKSDDILTQVNLISRYSDQKPRSALAAVERLKEKIRMMRRAGLMSPKQEFSAENIAFKILRRENILQRLSDLKYEAYDRIMSLELR
jgi:hypothetical protein